MVRGLHRVLVVKKTSLWDSVQKRLTVAAATLEDLAECQRILQDNAVASSHQAHIATLDLVQKCLALHAKHVEVSETFSQEQAATADLIVSVGGDGTFLKAVHAIPDTCDTPVLGVNSSPSTSYGYYCAALEESFPQVLDSFMSGGITPTPVWRVQVVINGVAAQPLILNDALFAGRQPADTVK